MRTILGIFCATLIVAGQSFVSATADTWRGTAPFCKGECRPGEREIRRDKSGDGGYCWTGRKVLCSNSDPTCQATRTIATCFGIVLVCENGSGDPNLPEDVNGTWRGCSTYACGVCLLFGSSSAALSSSSPSGWAPVP